MYGFKQILVNNLLIYEFYFDNFDFDDDIRPYIVSSENLLSLVKIEI